MIEPRTFDTLLLCTGNSARSQPAKAPDTPKDSKGTWLSLRHRIELLLALPLEKLDHPSRERELRLTGEEA